MPWPPKNPSKPVFCCAAAEEHEVKKDRRNPERNILANALASERGSERKQKERRSFRRVLWIHPSRPAQAFPKVSSSVCVVVGKENKLVLFWKTTRKKNHESRECASCVCVCVCARVVQEHRKSTLPEVNWKFLVERITWKQRPAKEHRKRRTNNKKRKQRVEESEIDYKTTSQNTIISSLELRKPAEPNLANKYTYYSKEIVCSVVCNSRSVFGKPQP